MTSIHVQSALNKKVAGRPDPPKSAPLPCLVRKNVPSRKNTLINCAADSPSDTSQHKHDAHGCCSAKYGNVGHRMATFLAHVRYTSNGSFRGTHIESRRAPFFSGVQRSPMLHVVVVKSTPKKVEVHENRFGSQPRRLGTAPTSNWSQMTSATHNDHVLLNRSTSPIKLDVRRS